MIRCGYCNMRLSRCQCQKKPEAKKERRTTKPAVVDPPEGQSTIHLIGASPKVQLRWWGQWKSAPNLLKTDEKAPSERNNT